jgi:integrase
LLELNIFGVEHFLELKFFVKPADSRRLLDIFLRRLKMVYEMPLVQKTSKTSRLTLAIFRRLKTVVCPLGYGIAWMHKISQLEDPVANSLVQQVLDSLRRKFAGRKIKKEIITVEILNKMLEASQPLDSLKNLRMITICLVSFAGFLRFDEVIKIRFSDLKFEIFYFTIFVESSKTDQYRDGAHVIIGKTGTDLCPFVMLQKYLQACVSLSGDNFIFRSFAKCKAGNYVLRTLNKPMTYSRTREEFLALLVSAGQNPKNFGLHSLRSGAASAAANAGVKDRLFKRHGRWLSDRAKDGYVKDDILQRLTVSQNLGL